jgi:hypothetical protein
VGDGGVVLGGGWRCGLGGGWLGEGGVLLGEGGVLCVVLETQTCNNAKNIHAQCMAAYIMSHLCLLSSCAAQT